MFSQFFINQFYNFHDFLNGSSDYLIVLQLYLVFSTFFVKNRLPLEPLPTRDLSRFIKQFWLIHILTLLIITFPGSSPWKVVCHSLCYMSEIQLVYLCIGPFLKNPQHI